MKVSERVVDITHAWNKKKLAEFGKPLNTRSRIFNF